MSDYRDVQIDIVCTDINKDIAPEYASHLQVRAICNPDMRTTEAQNYMCRNALAGHILPISDDMEFFPNTISRAVEALYKNFPDTDGVVGINTVNFEANDTSIMLIGDKFTHRFPSRMIYFPEYRHFGADTELGEFAKRTGRFVFCPEAQVKHFHPVSGESVDETHLHARRYLDVDLRLLKDRQEKSLAWGKA